MLIPKGLTPGTYPLKMAIQAFDLTTEKKLNGASTTHSVNCGRRTGGGIRL